MEVSHGIAETVRRCNVKVVSAYPITPQTHIVEKLSEYEGEFEYVCAESEFSALSIVMGASVAGVRVYTATASQGLALMHEVLHNCAGLRLPVVMTVANRSLSAPISIWNDWQDSLSQRDTGWLQLYCLNAQQAIDFLPIMYYVAEKILLPGMVCIDGFYLTHSLEVFDIPSKDTILELICEEPKHDYLCGVVGPLAGGEDYQKLRSRPGIITIYHEFLGEMKKKDVLIQIRRYSDKIYISDDLIKVYYKSCHLEDEK